MVSTYLERPLLLPGRRKFDWRLWVLLSYDYSISVYNEGVLRSVTPPPRPPPLHLSRLPTHTIATRNKPHAIAPTLSYSTLNSLDTLGGSRRTCSVPYDLSDLSDEFAHLSNHCIQTKSDNYGWAGRQHHHCVRSDLEPTRQHQHQYRHQHPTLTSAHLTRP